MRAGRVSRKAVGSPHRLQSGLLSAKERNQYWYSQRRYHDLVLHRFFFIKVRWRRMKVRPAQRIRGRLRLPGDKSISHRAAMIAALAEGTSFLSNFSTSQDCASTLDCLWRLGVSIEQQGSRVRVKGAGTQRLRAPAEPIDCGNSGSTMRI